MAVSTTQPDPNDQSKKCAFCGNGFQGPALTVSHQDGNADSNYHPLCTIPAGAELETAVNEFARNAGSSTASAPPQNQPEAASPTAPPPPSSTGFPPSPTGG